MRPTDDQWTVNYSSIPLQGSHVRCDNSSLLTRKFRWIRNNGSVTVQDLMHLHDIYVIPRSISQEKFSAGVSGYFKLFCIIRYYDNKKL